MMIAGSLAASEISDDEEAGTGTSEDARKMIYAAYAEAASRDDPRHMRRCFCCAYNQYQVCLPPFYYLPDHYVSKVVQSQCKTTPEAQKLQRIEKTCCLYNARCCWFATVLLAITPPITGPARSAMLATAMVVRTVDSHAIQIRVKRYLETVAVEYALEKQLPMPGVQIMGALAMRPEQLPLLKNGPVHED